ncbi:Uncharacterised protein [Candidatus Gugararchaeum adminiculabundum]|nr:Uncharacterised protein [Candidatus Gugararchaeum adminiculabundum]
MRALLIILALFPALVLVQASAETGFFSNALFAPPEPEIKVIQVIDENASNPLCFQGFSAFCKFTEKTEIVKKLNSSITCPFLNQTVEKLDYGCKYDEDDLDTLAHYDTRALKECGWKAESIGDVFQCSQEFNRQSNGTCKSSTSAFKIAYCSSALAGEKKNATSFEVEKIFVSGADYNRHRFIAVKNVNGYYVLDPLWCQKGTLEECVKKDTSSFYFDQQSPNYKGFVYKTERIG